MKFITVIISFVIVLVLCFFGWRMFNSRQQIAIDRQSVVFSPKWVNQAQFAGIFIADHKGFYQKRGLTVTIKEFIEKSSPLEDVVSGTSQLSLLSANEFLQALDEGQELVAVAAFYQLSPFVVVSLAQQGITSPFDFKGRILGTKGGPGAETDSVYALLFKASGLTEQDATFKYMPFGTSEYEDLLSEKADAIGVYRTDQMYFFKKNSVPVNLIFPEQYGSAIYDDVLVTTPQYLQDHPLVVKNFLTATVDGWRYAFNNPEDAVDITMKYVTHPVYKDPIYEKFILDQSRPLIMPDIKTKIGYMNHESWSKYVDNLLSLGVIANQVDIKKFFTNEYLP